MALAAIHLQFELPFEYVEESLRCGCSKFAAGCKFGSVLGESRTKGRTGVHNGCARFHAGPCGTNERVWRQKQMIGLLSASRLTEIMHGTSFFEIPWNWQVDRADATRIRAPLPRLPPRPIPPGRGYFRLGIAERSLRREFFRPGSWRRGRRRWSCDAAGSP